MSTTPSESLPLDRQAPGETISSVLVRINEQLDGAAADAPLDAAAIDALRDELTCLHARVRSHQAGDWITSPDAAPLSPEFAEERRRLTDEHTAILGALDRIIRTAASVADRSLEDGEVFVLKVRELIATIRRHTAEEDRLFYLSTWRDVGGES